MKKLLLLLLLPFTLFAQFGVNVVTPVQVIDSAGEQHATLSYSRNLFGSTRYYYYRSDENGKLDLAGGRIGQRQSQAQNVQIPANWTQYEVPCVIQDGELLAEWLIEDNEFELRAEIFNDSTYLTQTVSLSPHNFIVRGRNMLTSVPAGEIFLIRTDILEQSCYDVLLNEFTGIGGLEQPTFTTPQGYEEYTLPDGTKSYIEEGQSPPVVDNSNSLFTAFTETTIPNSVNLSQFQDLAAPSKLRFVFGHGSPMFTEMATTPALQLKKGWTHTSNSSSFGSSVFPESRNSAFFVPTIPWETLEASIAGTSNLANRNFSAVSNTLARDIGIQYAVNTAFEFNPTTGNFDRRYAHMNIDEEQWPSTGNALRVTANILQGIRNVTGSSSNTLVFYGTRWTSIYAGNPYKYQNFDYTSSEKEELINSYRLTEPAFYTSDIYADLGAGYFKVPIPITSTYYKKDANGDYILNNGKRQFRDDNFNESIFGSAQNFFHGPDFNKKNLQQNGAGQQIINATLQPGYDWVNSFPHHRNSSLYINDAYWAVHQQYLMHDIAQLSLLSLTKFRTGTPDITRWRDVGTKPIAVIRPRTEPWTYGGNSSIIREVGKHALKAMVTIPVMQGVHGIETWDDGTGGQLSLSAPTSSNTWKVKSFGNPLYPSESSDQQPADEMFTRYEHLTSAVQGVIKAFEGFTFDNTLRYFHFSKYIDSYQNKEILGGGVYQGGITSLWFLYPYHDPSDVTEIEVRIGDEVKNINLVGREPALLRFENTQQGIEPINITAQYQNIDGVNIHVTGDVLNHYATGITVPPVEPEGSAIPSDQFFSTVNVGSVGYLYGASYTALKNEISGGQAIFNYFGNPAPDNNYPAPNPQSNGSSFPSYTSDHVLVNFASHSVNLSNNQSTRALTGKVHYKVFDQNDNLILEVYDTKGGRTPDGNRTNNHPDECSRWIKRGTYRIWMKNISDDNVVIRGRTGSTNDPGLENIHGVDISKGQSTEWTVNFDTSHFSGTQPFPNWNFYKVNCNIY